MSKKSGYNSIVFLTTLSVYLGLVLVGGTAPALAQAALTRDFDIKNEIEFKDDLDKKPDEDLFVQTIANLVRELDTFSGKGIFDWETKSTFSVEDLSFCQSDDTPSFGGGSTGIDTERQELTDAFINAGVTVGRRFSDRKAKAGLGDFYSGYPEGVTFKFAIENKSFTLETQINTKNGKSATAFAVILDAYLAQNASAKATNARKIVAENTSSKVDDTKILLVTHLPRASIDELLAR
jgi:hypothetical protein